MSWIKIRTNIHDDPAVISIASGLQIDENTVVGALVRFWGWADAQSYDGNAISVTPAWLDRNARVTGLALHMQKVGWLIVNHDGTITIPNFDRHNGQNAKKRALGKSRQNAFRGKTCNATSVTEALLEERRGDKNNITPPPHTAFGEKNGLPETEKPAQPENPLPDTTVKPSQTHRDAIWDTIAAIWYQGSIPEPDRARIGRIRKILHQHGATGEEIKTRYANYRKRWPDMSATPEAIAKHWVALAGQPEKPITAGLDAATRAAERRVEDERRLIEQVDGVDPSELGTELKKLLASSKAKVG